MSFWSKFVPFGSSKKKEESNGSIATPNGTTHKETPKSKFGKELRKEFLFDEKYLNLNHGMASIGQFSDSYETQNRCTPSFV